MPDNGALIEEVRDNRQSASAEWDQILVEAKKDTLCVAGQPWEALDPDGLKQRRDAKRPHLALDELGQFINQTVNDVRAHPRGIKFAPTGNGANDAGAEFYQNHMREIEYRSQAHIAYATAFENAVTSSFGWVRVKTKREHIRTFNQDIWIEPVANPNQVLPGPSVWPDSRDLKYLYFIESWPIKTAEREFGKNVRGLSAEWRSLASQWVRKDTIDLAEYWKLETFTRQLVAFRQSGIDPSTRQPFQPTLALVDELPDGTLPPGVDNIREEDVEDTRVKAWLTDGLHILKDIPWVGKYIPFVSCYGKIIYVDEGSGSQKRILSMTRLARDPYMLYCYIRTCQAEAVGGVPRAQYVGYEGQFVNPNDWAKANHEPVPFLMAKAFVDNGAAPERQPLPLPQRQPWDPPIQNLELAAEAARRAIQAAMGITPLPTDMQRQNQKLSGTGMDKLRSMGQTGSFHFVDHHDLMIHRVGVIAEDLMPHTLDTTRDVPVRKPDDSAAIVRVNDPTNRDSVDTRGDYRVTISTGPASDSQREDADDLVNALVSNIATIAQIAGPQAAKAVLARSVKIKQLGPAGDELADILDPPQLGEDGKPLTPQMQALIAQNKQLQQKLQELGFQIQTKQVEGQTKYAIEQLKTSATSADKAAERAVKLDVAAIEAKIETMAMVLQELQRIGGLKTDAAERLHAAGQATLDRQHASIESAKDRIHDLNLARVSAAAAQAQSAQDHAEASQQADQGLQGQLAVQAAQPPAATTG